MGKYSRFWLILLFLFLLIGVVIYFFTHNNKFNINKITSTEIEKKLNNGNPEGNLIESNISDYLPDDISILFSKYYQAYSSPTYTTEKGLKITESKNGDVSFFEISSSLTGYVYQLKIKDGDRPAFLQITKYKPDYNLQVIIDKLIKKEGFVLKESDTKYGYDYLIKETTKGLIIVCILPNSNKSNPSSLTFFCIGK
jgi:hypothetical protein